MIILCLIITLLGLGAVMSLIAKHLYPVAICTKLILAFILANAFMFFPVINETEWEVSKIEYLDSSAVEIFNSGSDCYLKRGKKLIKVDKLFQADTLKLEYLKSVRQQILYNFFWFPDQEILCLYLPDNEEMITPDYF